MVVVDDPCDDSDDAYQKWRGAVQRALWDCFGMTAETFNRTYHGPELRRWFKDPARPQTTAAQAAAVMIRFYTSRAFEPFPTPGKDAAAWWRETLAGRDPAARNLPAAVVVNTRLMPDDLAAKITEATSRPPFVPLVLPTDAPEHPGPMEL